jgi:hypothetical protein
MKFGYTSIVIPDGMIELREEGPYTTHEARISLLMDMANDVVDRSPRSRAIEWKWTTRAVERFLKDPWKKIESSNEKRKYGEFNNVFLTDIELMKLKDLMGARADFHIESLSEYIENGKGKNYKSHYATIRSWARKSGDIKETPKTETRELKSLENLIRRRDNDKRSNKNN